jgi:hypothetical protein
VRTGERFHLSPLHLLHADLLSRLGGDPAAAVQAARDVAEEQGAGLFLDRADAFPL